MVCRDPRKVTRASMRWESGARGGAATPIRVSASQCDGPGVACDRRTTGDASAGQRGKHPCEWGHGSGERKWIN